MIKKLGTFLRFLFIFVFWSVSWLLLMRRVMIHFWNFDFLSYTHWKMIASFWDANGTIRGTSDYMFFITLLAVIVVWYVFLKKLLRVQYGKLCLRPFEYIFKKQIQKMEGGSKHIALKNLVVGEKKTLDDLIEEKIKAEDSKQSQKESQNLRDNIAKKIIERKGK